MDIDDITAVSPGAGSLRDRRTHTTRQAVGTFTASQPWNLDELHQHAQVLGAALRPGSRDPGPRVDQKAEHAAPHEETARMIRSAVRP